MRDLLTATAVGVVLLIGWYFFWGGARFIEEFGDAPSYAPRPPPLVSQLRIELVGSRISRNQIVSADVRVSNRSSVWVKAYVACIFLDRDGVIVGDSMGLVDGIAPGGEGRETVRWAARGQQFETTECSVSSAYEAR